MARNTGVVENYTNAFLVMSGVSIFASSLALWAFTNFATALFACAMLNFAIVYVPARLRRRR